MATLKLLYYPDPRLHTVARPVTQVDERIQTLARDMIQTMYEFKGIGLAASQVDVHERLIVIDTSDDRSQPMVLVNPEIVWASDEKAKAGEGCLSVPEVFDGVERPVAVHVKALDDKGQEQLIQADGLLALCIQHEMDHLLGKLFVDYLSPLKRKRIKTKMQKMRRELEI